MIRRPDICGRETDIACYDFRTQLVDRLTEDVRKNKEWLLETLEYPLAK